MTGKLLGTPNPKKANKPKESSRVHIVRRNPQSVVRVPALPPDDEGRDWETLTLRERLLARRREQRVAGSA